MPKTDILIEWLAFSLAVLAWIIFIALRTRNSNAEESREAGETLRKWTGGYNNWVILGSALLFVLYAWPIYYVVLPMVSPDVATLGALLNMTMLCVSLFPRRESLEICKNGIVLYQSGWRIFAPWKKMICVRISAATGKVVVEEAIYWRGPYKIPLSDVSIAIADLRQFVVVRDFDGRKLNPEFNPLAALSPEVVDRRKWQFSLRSVLLFMVLASCTMSWYSIHHRHDVVIDQLLEKLRKFQPEDRGLDRSQLAFEYGSIAKPHDDDLKLIAQWPGLSELDLSGTPVTDAGLEHLKDMKSLRNLNLVGTQVTAGGVRKLQQALPKCKMEFSGGK